MFCQHVGALMWNHMLQTVCYCVVTRLVQSRTGSSYARVAASPMPLFLANALYRRTFRLHARLDNGPIPRSSSFHCNTRSDLVRCIVSLRAAKWVQLALRPPLLPGVLPPHAPLFCRSTLPQYQSGRLYRHRPDRVSYEL